MAKKKIDTSIWIILIAVAVIMITLVIVFHGVPASNYPTYSVGFLSVGSSNGVEQIYKGKDIKTLSLVPECNPDSGFTKCFQYEKTSSYDDAQARAYVKIQGDDSKIQKIKNGYYVGTFSVPVKFDGDKFYLYENVGSWDNIWSKANCNKDGCSGATKSLSSYDSYPLVEPGQEYHGCPVFVAFDFDCDGDCFNDESPDAWAWSWTSGGWGWTGTSNCLNIKAVKCYDDSDCSSSSYCDKSGDWQTWDCKVKECTVDNDCAHLGGDSEPFCKDDGNSYVTETTGKCSSYKCSTTSNEKLNNKCVLGCSEDAGICNEGTTLFIVGIIVAIVLVVGIILFFVLRKNKRRRR